jgi:hypothetical protein
MNLPEPIKKMALNGLIKMMQDQGVKEGRFFINESGALDMDLAKDGDRFILESEAEKKVNYFKQINSELKEKIKSFEMRERTAL